MSDCNFALFTRPDQYEETLLRDRKAMVEYWKDDKKAEFVRDVIALANTARMLGKPAYLILGVRDAADGTPADICGIGEMFERQVRQGRTKTQAWETMRSEMAAIIQQYVLPILALDIRFCEVSDMVVGYVLISPSLGEPFQVKQEFRNGKQTYLRPGQCWLRFGNSKREVNLEEIPPEHDKLRYCYAEVPYVLPSVWKRYFDEVQREMQKLTQYAPEETAYQELRDSKGAPIQKIVDEFLAQNDERLLILQGAAGCGKSLFLQRLVNEQAEQGEQEMKDAQRQEQFTPPAGFIPIFYRLRKLTSQARTQSAHFTKILCDLLASLWKDNEDGKHPKYPEKLFEHPKLNWLIVLDGLDETGEYARRQEFLNILNEFMRAYPRLRVILTTRPSPGISLEGMDNAKLVEIAPLNEKQIADFLMAYRTDNQNEDAIYAFLEKCKRWEDAWKLLSVPAYLNAAALSVGIPRTITDAQEQPPEIPVKVETTQSHEAHAIPPLSAEPVFQNLPQGTSLEVDAPVTQELTAGNEKREEEFILTLPRLLDQIYEAFWKREGDRGILENINHFRCNTHKIAATSMKVCRGSVKRNDAQKCLKEKGLRWVLEMGILSENAHEHIFFTIPSAQVYSAAKHLQGDIEGEFWDTIFRYMRRWQNTYRAEIENFYNDLTGNPLSIVLQNQGGSNG